LKELKHEPTDAPEWNPAFGAKQADDRQRSLVVRLFGVAWQCGLRRSPRQQGTQGDSTIMCRSTDCSGPFPLLSLIDRVLQTDLT
jgi:hypothetical protein